MKIRYTAETHRDLDDALDHGIRTDPAATSHLTDRLLLVIECLATGEFEGSGPGSPATRLEVTVDWALVGFATEF